MIQQLFATLTRMIENPSALALAVALVWGILSIVLSPCHLSSIPLIVGFIDQQGRISTGRALAISSSFSVGILTTITVIGVTTASAGRMLGDIGPYYNYFVAAVFFLFGLVLLDVIQPPWSGPGQVNIKSRGLTAAFILGLVFGIALGPCTFAYMALMLAITFGLGAANPIYGAGLLLLYGIGHCCVIVAAGTCAELVQRYMNWNEKFRATIIVKRMCGAAIIIGGLYLIFTAR